MVIGGATYYSMFEYDDYYEEYVDIFYLKPLKSVEGVGGSNEASNCPAIADYPPFAPVDDGDFGIYGHTAVYLDGKVMSCGGSGISTQVGTNKCFQLSSALNKWTEMASLPMVTLGGKSSVIDGKWFITGGQNFVDLAQMVRTFLYEDGIFVPGPSMPSGKKDHCQLTVNSTHVFVTAGEGLTDYLNLRDTYLLDWPNQNWITLDDLPYTGLGDQVSGTCGLLNHPDNGPGERFCREVENCKLIYRSLFGAL